MQAADIGKLWSDRRDYNKWSMLEDWKDRQLALCTLHNAEPVAVHEDEKLGIARNVRSGLLPICGERHLPEHGTCGWYIWAGEPSDDPNFFDPVHIAHLEDWCERVMPFLLLPPGWRFIIFDDHYNAWFDPHVNLEPMS
jgi:hypothetical protein